MSTRVMEPPWIERSRPAAETSIVLLRHWDEAVRQLAAARPIARGAEHMRERADARRVRFAYD